MARHRDNDEAEYAKLGLALTRVLTNGHIGVVDNWKKFVAVNFARGLLVGLGSVVGATLVLALLVWLISIFGGLPIVGQWLDSLEQSLQPR